MIKKNNNMIALTVLKLEQQQSTTLSPTRFLSRRTAFNNMIALTVLKEQQHDRPHGSKNNMIVLARIPHLSLAPKSGHLDRVDNLEDALAPVHPVDVVPKLARHQQQLLNSKWSSEQILQRVQKVFLLNKDFRMLLFTNYLFIQKLKQSQSECHSKLKIFLSVTCWRVKKVRGNNSNVCVIILQRFSV